MNAHINALINAPVNATVNATVKNMHSKSGRPPNTHVGTGCY